jgi:hypothetical protein
MRLAINETKSFLQEDHTPVKAVVPIHDCTKESLGDLGSAPRNSVFIMLELDLGISMPRSGFSRLFKVILVEYE